LVLVVRIGEKKFVKLGCVVIFVRGLVEVVGRMLNNAKSKKIANV
jgi:hypothetical protein